MIGRRVVKLLTCPACGDIVAQATYRRFPPTLRIETPDGALVQPSSAGVLLHIAEQRVRDAAPAERAHAEAARELVRANLDELMYDLRCHRGHHTVQTMPAIVRAMRRTPGRWVPIP